MGDVSMGDVANKLRISFRKLQVLLEKLLLYYLVSQDSQVNIYYAFLS